MIDDDEDFIELVDQTLIRRGCVMTYADNGADGLRLAQLLEPDLVLLDIRMPGMDGYEVAIAIKAGPEFEHTRVVAVTGLSGERERARMADAGFDGYFSKSIDPETLIREVAPYLPHPLPEPDSA